ncbi:cyclic nucleotide-binding domain-containing protein [uncultured Ilyobacter sp.]|uniref:cyclic nucleotide-binding domain-containing protein n=1 Tax=uncultured Ilyobacter sp. TaxID=544433 RepID=UPI0029C8A36F|nr:cyclic nucleotide-binding domain-containing protein [uncultured Ilyobacter sp.]
MIEKKVLDRIFELLPKTSLFGGISEEDVEYFSMLMEEVSYKEGDVLYSEGEPPGDSYLILNGKVEFFMLGQKLGTVKEGKLFGVVAPLGIQKQLSTAKAKTDVTLAVIPKMALLKIAEERQELFGKLMFNIARDLARNLIIIKKILMEHMEWCQLD